MRNNQFGPSSRSVHYTETGYYIQTACLRIPMHLGALGLLVGQCIIGLFELVYPIESFLVVGILVAPRT